MESGFATHCHGLRRWHLAARKRPLGHLGRRKLPPGNTYSGKQAENGRRLTRDHFVSWCELRCFAPWLNQRIGYDYSQAAGGKNQVTRINLQT